MNLPNLDFPNPTNLDFQKLNFQNSQIWFDGFDAKTLFQLSLILKYYYILNLLNYITCFNRDY